MTDVTDDRSSGRALVPALILISVLALLAGAGAALLVANRDEVAPGTRIAGVAVGGMTHAQLVAVLDGPVTTEVARPIELHVADAARSLPPAEAGISLDRAATERAVFANGPSGLLGRLGLGRTTPHDVHPVIVFDAAAAKAALTSRLSEFSKDAADARMELAVPTAKLSEKLNASFTATDAGVRVRPAVTGQKVDVAAAVTALRATVAARGTSLTLPLVTTEPEVTTAEAAKVDQLIGTFTTLHPCCAPRVTNIHRIAEIVDGAVIAPGQTFSLNARSGRRTLERGFVNAPAIAEGELVSQVGGGVSQFSTTLFNAAWFSGLTIVKHQPHSKYISRYPPGREATLDYDTIDQVIRNDTAVPVVIRASTTATSVTVALYGHTGDRVVDSVTGPRVPRTGGGFSVNVSRTVRQDGSTLRTDRLSWAYTGLD